MIWKENLFEKTVFEDTSVSTPNERTVILVKDSQYYSPENEDAGSDICVCGRNINY